MAKLLLMVIVAALAVAAFSVFALREASAGSDLKVTVNTPSNHAPDGECEGDPNEGSGDCTLGEAILEANAGRADIINFRKSVFPKANPGVIYIDQEQTRNAELDGINGNDGCLPPLEAQVLIDSGNTGVILDGDFDNDGDAQDCSDSDVWGTKTFPVANREGVIQVYANKNGFDFTLIGGKNFIIREFDGETDGINFNGREIDDDAPDHILGDILITGYIFQDGDIDDESDLYDSQDGIDLDEIDKVINAQFTNNNITADDDGIEVNASGDKSCFVADAGAAGEPIEECFKISSSSVLINENTILADFDDTAAGDGVQVVYDAHLNGKILVEVIDNPSIASKDADAVDIEYCDAGEGCDAGQSEINIDVSRNNKLHGGESGGNSCVEIDIEADEGPNSAGSTDVSVDVNDNGLCDAGGGDGYVIQVDICCDASFSTATVNVNGNDDIIADEDGVDLELEVGCGDGNEINASVSDNRNIEGQGNGGGHGVVIEANAGEASDGCTGTDTESDENAINVLLNDNGRIDGGDAQAVDISGTAGADADGNGDDNVWTVAAKGNGRIHGQEQGILIDIVAGSEEGDDGDDNIA
ncbi:MAG: hypothetical protein WD939_08105, partial [Dehalococcoidia bacterium]